MRFTFSFIGLLLLPLVVGCEGNTPRRSPLAPTSVPTAAKEVPFAPKSKITLPTERPANPVGQPVEDVPAPMGNAPITIDGDKLETRRQLLNYHTAIFLKNEVGTLTTTGINDNNNFVTRTVEGLGKVQITSAIYANKADNKNGKPPQTVVELKNLIGDFLTELKPNEFYIYDPELVTEANKEEMLYLQQYP